jgi:hypothetical protein
MADYNDKIIITGAFASSFRTGSDTPAAYRLVRRGSELLLQGRFDWTDGKQAGFDWKDIPTVVEEEEAELVTRPPLWEPMHCAFSKHRDPGSWRLGYGAILRAIAERIEDEYASGISVVGVVSMLRAEADRAEKGDAAD